MGHWESLRSFPFPIDILIDPNDPERGILATGRTGTMMGVVLIIVGAIVLVVGLMFAIMANSFRVG